MAKSLEELFTEIDRCKDCITLEPWQKFPNKKKGNPLAKAMIVSEAPGETSIENKQLWTGMSGLRLRKILREFHYELEDIFYLTDTIKCLPKGNRNPTADELINCSDFLMKEIYFFHPEIVLTFGNFALDYIRKWFVPYNNIPRGKITDLHNRNGYKRFRFKRFTHIPLLHPSFANRFIPYSIYKSHLREVFREVIAL